MLDLSYGNVLSIYSRCKLCYRLQEASDCGAQYSYTDKYSTQVRFQNFELLFYVFYNKLSPIFQVTCLQSYKFTYYIWDQKLYFWNFPSGADIYLYNKINPMLLTALCLLLIPCCSLLFVYNSLLFIVEYLWWSMHVRCEYQCVSNLGLLLLLQLVFNV